MNEKPKSNNAKYWIIFAATAVIVFILGILAASITQRNAEKEYVYKPIVKINDLETRNEIWGENFPREFQTWLETLDTTFRTKYNGNAFADAIEEDPRLAILWAGYLFSRDYNKPRGHAWSIEDIRKTLRTGAPMNDTSGPQPTTCWTCKSPDVVRIMKEQGVENYYKGKWARLGSEIVNPIGCLNCHDPKTMNLTIKSPALIEAYQAMGKDIKKASLQDMRSLVCAQCHVEYYFDKKRVEGAQFVKFPWDKGLTVENIEEYYDSYEFADWKHAISKAPMLKAQHPDYELYLMGIHGQRNVACADCHMPYISEGGQKFSSHQTVSPLKYIDKTCQVCHRESEQTLIKNVYDRYDKVIEVRDKLEVLLVRAHFEAKKAWDLGAKEDEMKDILQGIRKAQWRWDFVAASHGGAFHAPIEGLRILSNGIDIITETRIKLARLLAKYGFNDEVPYPEIPTKEKAQKLIGLDMDKLKAEKKEFLEKIVPQWIKIAEERQAKWKVIRY